MRIGIDLGGTKIEAIALDEKGATLVRRRVPTPQDDYAGILGEIAQLVFALEAETGASATVGMATPGTISPRTGLIKNSNSTVLNGKRLDRDIADRLRRDVRIDNDANCFALSEAVDGAAAEANVVFGAILGTGVGGGLVINKRPVSGRNRIAGEWGHNPLPWPAAAEQPGPQCYCGKSGCIETFLSGAGLRLEYLTRKGRAATVPEIVLAAGTGDDIAQTCLAVYRDRLARGLASVINVVDPDAIVLGGGLSNIAEIYVGLSDLVAKYSFSDAIDTPIVPAAHGDSSGVRGAAWLWPIS
jgi:fructokinase